METVSFIFNSSQQFDGIGQSPRGTQDHQQVTGKSQHEIAMKSQWLHCWVAHVFIRSSFWLESHYAVRFITKRQASSNTEILTTIVNQGGPNSVTNLERLDKKCRPKPMGVQYLKKFQVFFDASIWSVWKVDHERSFFHQLFPFDYQTTTTEYWTLQLSTVSGQTLKLSIHSLSLWINILNK